MKPRSLRLELLVASLLGWLCGACGNGPTLLVGELSGESLERGEPLACVGERVVGPSGFLWCLEQRQGGHASFSTEPTLEEIRADLISPRGTVAGLSLLFGADGEKRDLGIWSELVIDGDLEQGRQFDVFVGDGNANGCVYYLDGRGPAQYRISLKTPDWCSPSPCGAPLTATGVSLRASYWRDTRASLTVRSVEFVGPHLSESVRAFGSGPGPSEWCWFLLGRESGTSEWHTPLSEEKAQVTATSPPQAVAGMGAEFPTPPESPEALERVEVDAHIEVGTPFDFVLGSAEQSGGCIYRRLGRGHTTYTLFVKDWDSCFGRGLVAPISNIQLVTPFDSGGTLRAEVSAVRAFLTPETP